MPHPSLLPGANTHQQAFDLPIQLSHKLFDSLPFTLFLSGRKSSHDTSSDSLDHPAARIRSSTTTSCLSPVLLASMTSAWRVASCLVLPPYLLTILLSASVLSRTHFGTLTSTWNHDLPFIICWVGVAFGVSPTTPGRTMGLARSGGSSQLIQILKFCGQWRPALWRGARNVLRNCFALSQH